MTGFSTNDQLRELRERYRASTDLVVERFRTTANQLARTPGDAPLLDALRHDLHRVRGTAGSYGFAEASQLAAALEDRVAGWVAAPTLGTDDRALVVAEFARGLEAAFKA